MTPAGAATQLSWVMSGGDIRRMGQQDLAAASHFFDTPARACRSAGQVVTWSAR